MKLWLSEEPEGRVMLELTDAELFTLAGDAASVKLVNAEEIRKGKKPCKEPGCTNCGEQADAFRDQLIEEVEEYVELCNRFRLENAVASVVGKGIIAKAKKGDKLHED